MVVEHFEIGPDGSFPLDTALIDAVAACREQEPVSGNRSLLVGNSILTAAASTVGAAVHADGWDPTIRAYPGTKITDWAKTLPSGSPSCVTSW